LSRGDRNRNARLARLRELVPFSNAIVGIDLADDTQAVVVTDHDSRVLARRRVRARAWELGEVLDWAVARAAGAGFASVTVACEPTGHRWRVLDQLAAGRELPLVCVQPLLVYRAREGEDLTRDKSDPLTELPGEVPQVSGRMGVLVATVADHDHRRRCAEGPVPAGDAAGRVA
jgi:transposase